MDLVTLTVGLPFAPLRGLLALANLLEEEAERELYSPNRVRRELEEIEEAQSQQSLSDEDAQNRKQQALTRLVGH
jgi:gas vesicle protein GvpG